MNHPGSGSLSECLDKSQTEAAADFDLTTPGAEKLVEPTWISDL